jgi:hypothetical protein
MFNPSPKNNSSAYGYYGGVPCAKHYVPPPAPDFVPCPPTLDEIVVKPECDVPDVPPNRIPNEIDLDRFKLWLYEQNE